MLTLLLVLLPALAAAEAETDPAPAAPEPQATAGDPPAEAAVEASGSDAPGAEGDAAAGEAPVGPKTLHGYTGVVQKVMTDGVVVRRTGPGTDPKALPIIRFAGGRDVDVTGQGKSSWLALRRGDIVLVSYVKGPPAQARKVNVLRTGNDRAEAVLGRTTKPDHRTFIGYVKRKDGDALIVMKPPVRGKNERPAEIKAFVRREDTTVSVLRDAWDDLRKGDRLKIAFQKGNPRPIDEVEVIWRGGENPLPPGTATRLYHPLYDESVEDVDGIGEIGPVPEPPKRAIPKQKIRIPRPQRP